MKIVKLKGDWNDLSANICLTGNAGQKNLKQTEKITQNRLDQKLSFMLLHNYLPLLSKFISGKDTGYCTLPPANFDIFLIYPNFLFASTILCEIFYIFPNFLIF